VASSGHEVFVLSVFKEETGAAAQAGQAPFLSSRSIHATRVLKEIRTGGDFEFVYLLALAAGSKNKK
jgi:hypothetical protein